MKAVALLLGSAAAYFPTGDKLSIKFDFAPAQAKPEEVDLAFAEMFKTSTSEFLIPGAEGQDMQQMECTSSVDLSDTFEPARPDHFVSRPEFKFEDEFLHHAILVAEQLPGIPKEKLKKFESL